MIFLPVTGGFIGRSKASEEEMANAQNLSGTHKFNVKEITGLTGLYARILHALASHPIGNLGTIVAVCIIGFGIVATFMQHSKGVEFFIDEEPRIAMVYVSARGNMSAEESRGTGQGGRG